MHIRQKCHEKILGLPQQAKCTISIMNTKFPGFALSWESAFKEAQEEIKQLDSGIKAWMRKVFKPSAELPLSLSHSQDAIDETQNEYETNENFSSQSTND